MWAHPAWYRSNISENTHGRFLFQSLLETMLRKTLCLTKTSVGQFFPSMKILGVNKMEAKIVGKKNSLNWRLSFCLIFLATNMLEGLDISHMKRGSHSSVRSTKSFLYNIRDPRYKQIKMVHQILKILDIELSSV